MKRVVEGKLMSLTDRHSHFEFGENWRDYAKSIDGRRIEAAISGLRKLFPDGLAGRSFLDIGCGSGLHALAAFELGAKSVLAIDIDENSVAATRETLSRFAKDKTWDTKVVSVFDATPEKLGKKFDVVYSWGVLHHTGDMWRAISAASNFVEDDGLYAIAIYVKTPMCNFWRREKRLYTNAPKLVQRIMRWLYMVTFLSFLPSTGWRPISFIRDYKNTRGMNFSNDVHDWLGGYPYESASQAEILSHLSDIGFTEVRSFPLASGSGIWGSGCGEYVFTRAAPRVQSPRY
jgi:2-polyprenyl-6-hydroxyphenyl methylase/3-demethylubiquinone-9 3-methyltransferase